MSPGRAARGGATSTGKLSAGRTSAGAASGDAAIGATTVRSLATGISHSCALLSTGDVKCWGVNQYGQLGLGHTTPVGTLASELGAAMKAVPLD